MMTVTEFRQYVREYFLHSTLGPKPLGIWLINLEDWSQAQFSAMPTCNVCGQVTEQADGMITGWSPTQQPEHTTYCSQKCLDFHLDLGREYEVILSDMNRTT